MASEKLGDLTKGGYQPKSRDPKGAMDLDHLVSTLYPNIPGAVKPEPAKAAASSPAKAAKQDLQDQATPSEQLDSETPGDAPLSPLPIGQDPPTLQESTLQVPTVVQKPAPAADPMDIEGPGGAELATKDLGHAPTDAPPVANGLRTKSVGPTESSEGLDAQQNKSVEVVEAAAGAASAEDASEAEAGTKRRTTRQSGKKRKSASAAEEANGNDAMGDSAANGHLGSDLNAQASSRDDTTPAAQGPASPADTNGQVVGISDGIPPQDEDVDDRMLTEDDPTDGAPIEPDPKNPLAT